MDFWKHITIDKHILDGFRQCVYFDFDGSIDKLHPKLHDAIKNREVPYNLVKKVNAVIDVMKSYWDDEVQVNHDKEVGENDFEIKISEDLDQQKRENGRDE